MWVIEDLVPGGRRPRRAGRVVFVLSTGIAWNQLPAAVVRCSG
jgi:hypothetical protein